MNLPRVFLKQAVNISLRRGRLVSPITTRPLATAVPNKESYQFQTESEEKKFEFVRGVFNNVANNYDLMNDVLSVGVHRLWKRYFIEKLDPYPGTKLLDVAGGTGDIAFEFLRYATEKGDSTSSVVVCDINENMMKVGQQRAAKQKMDPNRLDWVHGDGLNLPFEENTFDAYSVVFGIRNMVNLPKAIDEAYRVLKPGGIFMCMEFSQVNNVFLKSFYDWYSYQMIPVIGEVVSNDFKSYQYLVESIRKFPDQETFKAMIEEGGFKLVDYDNLSCGIAAIHSGYKPL
ncbi:Coq5p [Tyrophagus putrescentiae]|nr:Coq5p [Tyrophagus putrescentiae]